MGQSQRETATNNALQANARAISGGTPIDKFNYQFGAPDFTRQLDSILNTQTQGLNRQANTARTQGQSDIASRLASQGISGGSLFNNQVAQQGNQTNKSLFDALQQLGQGRLGQQMNVMNQANQNGFNLANSQTQALLNLLGQQNGLAQNANPDTTATDIFAGLNAGAGLLNPILGFLKKPPTNP